MEVNKRTCTHEEIERKMIKPHGIVEIRMLHHAFKPMSEKRRARSTNHNFRHPNLALGLVVRNHGLVQ
jgi:hypothetical protein